MFTDAALTWTLRSHQNVGSSWKLRSPPDKGSNTRAVDETAAAARGAAVQVMISVTFRLRLERADDTGSESAPENLQEHNPSQNPTA
jgi:hypothetical protein